ncbi:MAG: ArgE/DapE family deacylase [Candidatus Limnocylindrales bacterium]
MTPGLSRLEQAIADSIDPVRVERELRAILAIPSVTGDEATVQSAIAGLMAESGLVVERVATDPAELARDPDWPGSEVSRTTLPVVIGRAGSPGRRRIIVLGHVDVVPVGDEALWRSPPWTPTLNDGALFGRGAVDMKGGVIAGLAAVRAAAAARGPDGSGLLGEVQFVTVPSEEDGGAGMLAAIRAGVTGDAAVIPEPSGLDIVTAHAGAITFRLTITGKAAHASKRREGVSALDKLGVLTDALAADEARRNAAERRPRMAALGLPYPTIIGKVNGGEWASTVIDRIVAEGRYGVRLGDAWPAAEIELRAVIAAACAADPWLRDHPATVEITGGRFSSAEIADDHPLPASLAQAVEDTLGRRPAFLAEPYGADMRLLIHEGRTPTVMFGPGRPEVAHAPNEHVRLAEVVACARALAVWLLREVGPA